MARSLIWVGLMDCCTWQICRGADYKIPRSCSASAITFRWKYFALIASASASRWDTNSCCPIPGKRSKNVFQSAPASPEKLRVLPTTALSWNWSRALKVWCTFQRWVGPNEWSIRVSLSAREIPWKSKCLVSILKGGASVWAWSKCRKIPGSCSPNVIRSAIVCMEKFATLLTLALSWKSKRESTV